MTYEAIPRDWWESHPAHLQDALAERPSSSRAATDARLTLTVEEAAASLGISRSLAYDAVRSGQIPSIKIGRRVLVPREQLAAMLRPAGPL